MTVRASLKSGVEIRGISPEAVLAVVLVSHVFCEYGVPLVLTSIKDGKHMEKSIHYIGGAFDVRLPSRYTNDPATDRKIVGELREALGDNFDVVLEADHVHVELDPKPPKEVA
jgi:hypothetical protein